MTNYAILRTKKLHTWGNIAGSLGHTYRKDGMAPNADPKLISRNKTLIGNAENSIDDVRRRINDITESPRKNAVLCVEHLLTASPEFFNGKTQRQVHIWAKKNIEFLQKKYGKENVTHAVLHLDESTPHIAAYIIPEVSGKLNAREIFGGRSKLIKLQSDYATAMKSFGLERGVEGSKAHHTDVKKFYGDLNKVAASADMQLEKISKPVDYPAPNLRAIISKEWREAEKKIWENEDKRQKSNIVKIAGNAVLNSKKRKDEVEVLKHENSILSAQVDTLKDRLNQAYDLLELSKDEISKLRKIDISLVASHLNFFDKIEKGENAIDLVKRVNGFDYQQSIAWLHNEFGSTGAAQAVREHLEVSKPDRPFSQADNIVKNAITAQLDALSCERYRISIISSDSSVAPYLPGKRGNEERFYTKEGIINMIPYLRYHNNVENKQIFVTPIDDNNYYILIDDLRVSPEKLIAAGYNPCLIQETSWNSKQAVLKVPKEDLDRRKVIDFFNSINQKIGDAKMTGLRHPFRLSGFRNMKPKHEKDGKFPLVMVTHAINQFCKKTYQTIKNMSNIKQKKSDLEPNNSENIFKI